MPTLVNLTPHPVVLRSPEGTDTILAPSGVVARVAVTPGSVGPVEGFPCLVAEPDGRGDVEGLPDPATDTFCIVSALVGDTLVAKGIHRPDVLVLGTGPKDGTIRNEQGHVVAVTRVKRLFA
jgi:hypothetical protein